MHCICTISFYILPLMHIEAEIETEEEADDASASYGTMTKM